MDDPALHARLRHAGAVRRRAARTPAVRASARRPLASPAPQPAISAPAPNRGIDEGTLYLKISRDKENPAVLRRVQALLKKHPGRTGVALYYERESKLLMLNVDYRVEVTPALVHLLERLLGKNTVKLK
jgi:DNA polymerase-3 subunit alpha